MKVVSLKDKPFRNLSSPLCKHSHLLAQLFVVGEVLNSSAPRKVGRGAFVHKRLSLISQLSIALMSFSKLFLSTYQLFVETCLQLFWRPCHKAGTETLLLSYCPGNCLRLCLAEGS